MSERKVLNKYYPPDFDPSKIPRLRLPKNRQYTVRLMAPCNMRCTTCGEYIYKGKKFNARKETVENEEYLGTKVFRFYIKCPRCLSEITFKTDPANADYTVEHGATRNFQALKLAEEQAEREAKEEEEEEKSNPMKLLEKRTKTSKQEMEILEGLEDLKDVNQRQARVDYEALFNHLEAQQQAELERQEREDEEFVRSIFGKKEVDFTSDSGELKIKMLDEDSDEEAKAPKKPRITEKPSLVPESLANKSKEKDLKSMLTSGPFAIRVKSKTAKLENKEVVNGTPQTLLPKSEGTNTPSANNSHVLSLCDYSDSEEDTS